MLRILSIIPDLGYCGAGKQLVVLAKNLPKDRFTMAVCAMSPDGPLSMPLRNASVAVEVLNWRRALDIRPLLRFRQLLKEFDPHAIHAWRKPAWRFACAAAWLDSQPLIISDPELKQGSKAEIARLDRRLLRRATSLVACSKLQAGFYLALGIPQTRVAEIQLAVENVDTPLASGGTGSCVPDLPVAARIIACVGPIEVSKAYLDAIWAFDILKYLYPDLHLVIAGDGPDRERLENFVRADQHRAAVHVIGSQSEIETLLLRAEVVWVPSRVERGMNVALEAMARGRPVVASALPGLAEIIGNGEAGVLVPPGDKIALARQTRLLLDDAERRQKLGVAGKERAISRFGASRVAQRYGRLYESAAGLSQ